MNRQPAAVRRTLVGLGLLAVTGCGAAEATPAPPPAAYAPHPAIGILDRLERGHEDAVPDVTGLEAGEAGARLRSEGLREQVVAFGTGPVTAQYPEPGSGAPPDGVVVVWTGTPPAPPPPPEPEPAAAREPPADDRPEPGPGTEVEPATGAAPPAPAAAPSAAPPVSSPTDPAPGSTPPRTSPRRLGETAPGTVLEGPASWYGPGFAGRTTACGDTFDPDALTLATRELRCGTPVRVTGPAGASVEAVVTDWGPAEWTGRRFDLSRATFTAVHHLGAGVTQVTVEVLAP